MPQSEFLPLIDGAYGVSKGDRKVIFSPCRMWRYALTQVWDRRFPMLVFVMLNPSTADERQNDPTVERCERRAHKLGFGGVAVYNAFAYRSTDPRKLRQVDDPIGPTNDKYLASIVDTNKPCTIVVAWGKHASLGRRFEKVLQILSQQQMVYCLGQNKDGSPVHPLYISYDQPLLPFRTARQLDT